MGRTDPQRGLIDRVAAVLDDPPVALDVDATVIAAVSGGPDSVAMLHLVVAARPDLDVVVGHVRHGLRDDAADAEAARANADALGLGYHERHVEVADGQGPEDAARRARYRALAAMADEVAAAAVLLGHTADDQAETVLLRIARGTGVPGLAGMDVVSQRDDLVIVRPLLGERRSDVRAVAAGHPTVEDPTNTDPDQRRARARYEVLPALRRLHPSGADVVPLLVRLADHAREHLTECAQPVHPAGTDDRTDDVLTGVVRARRFGNVIDVRLEGTSPAVGHRERLLRRPWDLLPDPPPWPGTSLAARLADLAVGESADVAGAIRVTRLPADPSPPSAGPDPSQERFVLVAIADDPLPPLQLTWDHPVAVPGFGTLVLEDLGIPQDVPAEGRALPRRRWLAWDWTVVVATAAQSLTVRGRRPEGDRVARRVLQTFPAALRGQVPLVADSDDRLVMAGPRILSPPRPGVRLVRITARSGETIAIDDPPDR